jgi:hypothetical protein
LYDVPLDTRLKKKHLFRTNHRSGRGSNPGRLSSEQPSYTDCAIHYNIFRF